MQYLKRGLIVLLSIAVILTAVFLAGRYGWRLGGFCACQGAGISTVEVSEKSVRVSPVSIRALFLRASADTTVRSGRERSMLVSVSAPYLASLRPETLIAQFRFGGKSTRSS